MHVRLSSYMADNFNFIVWPSNRESFSFCYMIHEYTFHPQKADGEKSNTHHLLICPWPCYLITFQTLPWDLQATHSLYIYLNTDLPADYTPVGLFIVIFTFSPPLPVLFLSVSLFLFFFSFLVFFSRVSIILVMPISYFLFSFNFFCCIISLYLFLCYFLFLLFSFSSSSLPCLPCPLPLPYFLCFLTRLRDLLHQVTVKR